MDESGRRTGNSFRPEIPFPYSNGSAFAPVQFQVYVLRRLLLIFHLPTTELVDCRTVLNSPFLNYILIRCEKGDDALALMAYCVGIIDTASHMQRNSP